MSVDEGTYYFEQAEELRAKLAEAEKAYRLLEEGFHVQAQRAERAEKERTAEFQRGYEAGGRHEWRERAERAEADLVKARDEEANAKNHAYALAADLVEAERLLREVAAGQPIMRVREAARAFLARHEKP